MLGTNDELTLLLLWLQIDIDGYNCISNAKLLFGGFPFLCKHSAPLNLRPEINVDGDKETNKQINCTRSCTVFQKKLAAAPQVYYPGSFQTRHGHLCSTGLFHL